MNLTDYYKSCFRKIYVIDAVREHPVTRRVLQALDSLPARVVAAKEEIPPGDLNQHTLLINAPRARNWGRCPGSRGHLCCNYLTIDLYAGCLLGCTYCIMRSYLNFSPVIVNVPIEGIIEDIRQLARRNAPDALRVGTGEVGDSLLFDPLFGLSAELVTAFAGEPNIHLELKTKTDFVDHLLALEPKGRAVIGFSLNPPEIIAGEEGSAVSLERRLAAATKAAEAGYRVALHFDPIFHFPGWEAAYESLCDRLPPLPAEKIAWISLGTFRYLPGLKDKISRRWYLFNEFVPCRDKKYRYLQPLRTEIYRHLAGRLQARFPGAPLYMCMESPAVWEKVFGQKPGKITDLCAIFKPVNL